MAVKITNRDRGMAKTVAGWRSGTIDVGVWSQVPHPSAGIPIAELASTHELGLGVPQRSFVRAWVDTNQRFVQLLMRRYWIDVAAGRMTSAQAFDTIGEKIEKAMQQYILDGKVVPPLAASTVANKGHSTPLVDTYTLVRAIEHRSATTPRSTIGKKTALAAGTGDMK